MAYGILDLSLWGYVVVGLVLTHITIASVTIFLHRHQAHRALELHPLASHFFRFWLWLTTGMITREWVAVHRKHHAKCETAEDPHSPQILGLNRVLWGGVSLYQATAAQEKTLAKYGRGTPDDWLERNLYSAHQMAGILLMLFVDLVLFGVLPGALIWGAQMAWIPFWAAGVINGVGHYWGYRTYETADASTNIVPWGIIIGGEELHNNHHAYASSARLSSKWWEIRYRLALHPDTAGIRTRPRQARRTGPIGATSQRHIGHRRGRSHRDPPVSGHGDLCPPRNRPGAQGGVTAGGRLLSRGVSPCP